MIGLQNTSIATLLEHCGSFYGVFSSDNIPKHLKGKNRFSIICNLSPKSKSGTHFIAIIAYNQTVIYMDSIGLPCSNNAILTFLKSLNRKIYFNNQQHQSVFSNYCGFYCMLYVLYFNTPKYFQIQNKIEFTNNYARNDQLCYKFVKYLLKYTL